MMFEALAVQPVVGEREARAVVHRRLVVDDGDLPARPVLARRPGIRVVVDQLDDVVWLGHGFDP